MASAVVVMREVVVVPRRARGRLSCSARLSSRSRCVSPARLAPPPTHGYSASPMAQRKGGNPPSSLMANETLETTDEERKKGAASAVVAAAAAAAAAKAKASGAAASNNTGPANAPVIGKWSCKKCTKRI